MFLTTNYDDLLERAFISAGEEFELVTYLAESEQRGRFSHQPWGTDRHTVIHLPNEYDGFSLDRRSVILKIHGSIDRADASRDSYVATENDSLEILGYTDISGFLPAPLAPALQRNHFLFLGYRLRDWTLRVILRRIWGREKPRYASWSVQRHAAELDRLFWTTAGCAWWTGRSTSSGASSPRHSKSGVLTPTDMDNHALAGESPYKGLAPYTEADSEWFFGRDSQVRVVSTNLMSARITVLYAGSGVGKTSILRAGVLPALHQEARRSVGRDGRAEFAVALHSRWQDDPITSLRETVASAVAAAGGRPPTLDHPAHLDDALAGCADAVDAGLLVIFDQFEEWFLYHGQTIGEGSPGDELVRAMTREDIPVRYLVSLREDALARLDWFKGRVPGMFENLLRLRHLDRPAGRAAIEGPIARYNAEHADAVEIEPGAVERVLGEVRAGAVQVGQQGQGAIAANGGAAEGERIEAPFLQLVMTRLWNEERARESGRLRLDTLERLGGADRIVGTYLDESLGALDPEDQTVAADAFNHLVTPSGTKIAHSVTDLAQYTGASGDRLETVLGDLTRMRILRPVAPPPGEDRSSRFEIFHDVLAPAVLDWRTRFLHKKSSDQLAKRFGRTLRRTAVAVVIVVARPHGRDRRCLPAEPGRTTGPRPGTVRRARRSGPRNAQLRLGLGDAARVKSR